MKPGKPWNLFLLALVASLWVGAGWAELTSQEVARLGAELTPLGGEKAGNAAGTIPAWKGGITSPPAGYKPGGPHIDPFAADQVALKITAANMDQYADQLSEGHKAMLRKYNTFYMNVYPTRRSASYRPAVYEGTKKTAATAKLIDDGNGLANALMGYPFPIPKNGLEVLWNVNVRIHGSPGWEARQSAIAAVTRGGDYTLTRFKDWANVTYWNPDTTPENQDNILWKYRRDIVAPPRLAGTVMLLHETVNQTNDARRAWVYNPGQRRVRRAPEFAFDNPWEGSDGLMTIDQAAVFNGSPERYNWELVGKKELYVPYNAYRLNSRNLKYADILRPLHPAPEHLRYELHRVWIVKGSLKEGARHLYKTRVMYVDEDTWTPCVADIYDNRDNLWRVSENHPLNYYDVPVFTYGGEMHYDLVEGRYAANFMSNEEPPWNVGLNTDDESFTTQELRRAGHR